MEQKIFIGLKFRTVGRGWADNDKIYIFYMSRPENIISTKQVWYAKDTQGVIPSNHPKTGFWEEEDIFRFFKNGEWVVVD